MSDAEPTGGVVIDRRFRGPDESANGGYAAGLLATTLGAGMTGPVEVRLHVPPPLGVELSLASLDGETAEMTRGGDLVATARRTSLEPAAITPLTFEEARRASPALKPDQHPFPACFVCGPRRGEGDGLRIFPGAVDGTERFGATWIPDHQDSHDGSAVTEQVVWAALDCPTGIPVLALDPTGPACVLGTIAVAIRGPVIAGEPHVLTSRLTGSDRRKHFAEAVLSRAGGEILAASSAVWISLG